MSTPKYLAQEYRNMLIMSANENHLLVEGRKDALLFEILFEEFFGTDWKDRHRVVIDNAESLISSENIDGGNREKVENLCNSFTEKNLTGFVDREFRMFEIKDKIIDSTQSHHRNNNLIWSRGHSAENYYFDAHILRLAFRDLCGNKFNKAYELFQKNIESYLRTATIMTFFGYYSNQFDRIKPTIGWNIFTPKGDLNFEIWEKELQSRTRFSQTDIQQIRESFARLNNLVKGTDIDTVKWFCHGHIGSAVLWAAFSRCIYEVVEGNDEVKRKAAEAFLRHQNNIGLNMCGRAWATAASNGSAEYPDIVFKLLKIG